VSEPKLDAVRAYIGNALRSQATRYVASLDDGVLRKILDSAKSGQPTNVQVSVPVSPDGIVRAESAPPPIRVGKGTLVNNRFLCDIYLAGPPGEWRDSVAGRFEDWVICNPGTDLHKVSDSAGPADRVLYEVPKGIVSRSVLYYAGDAPDDDTVGGLLTTVWFHGMSAAVVVGDCPQKSLILAVCQLAGAHVFDSLDDAADEIERMLKEGPEPSAIHMLPTDGLPDDDDDNETSIRLPSGNHLVLRYFGADGHADRVMLHSRSADAGAPPNLDLIIPDPDRETEDTMLGPDGGEVHPVDVHRVRVRHHGPTDPGRGVIPPDFLPPPTS